MNELPFDELPISRRYRSARRAPLAGGGRVLSALIALSLTFVSAAGCGDDGGGADARSIPESDFAAEYAKVLCDGLAGCCSAASVPLNYATCMREMTEEGDHVVHRSTTTASYNGVRAVECIDHVKATIAACVTSSDIKQALTLACRFVQTGTTVPGGSCMVDQDCAFSGEGIPRCYAIGSSSLHCVMDTPGRLGDGCGPSPPDPSAPTVTHQFCGEGLVCGMNAKCEAPTPAGETCQNSPQCGTSSFCDVTTRTCQPRVPLGSECVFDFQCTSDTCHNKVCAIGEPVAEQLCFQ